MNTEKIEQIARVTHAANRAYCESIGDQSQKMWHEAENWQRESAIAGVQKVIENPDITPADLHSVWCLHKEMEGWVYGEVKDAEKKTHPCLTGYANLPEEQKRKDALFRAVVNALL